MMQLKKVIIVILIAIMILSVKNQYLAENISLDKCIIYVFNSFSIDKLMDIFSILIYSLPITFWVITVEFNINGYYENFIFLVTRLGGRKSFNKKLLISAFREITILIISTYLIIITLMVITKHFRVGDISLVLLSLLLNYTVVIMLVIIFMIFRIYYHFSLAFTFTYVIEISLLVIGLFLKYIQSRILLINNPMINTIMFFYGETIKINSVDYAKIIVLNLMLIIILISIDNYLLLRRREIND